MPTINSSLNKNLPTIHRFNPMTPKAQSGWNTISFADDRVQGYGVASAGAIGNTIDFDLVGIPPGTYQLEGLVHAATSAGVDVKIDGVKVTDFDASTLSAAILKDDLYGDGSDGAITRSVTGTEDAVVNATTYVVDAGVTMTPGVGRQGIVIKATESITINGELNVDGVGAAGGNGGVGFGVQGGIGQPSSGGGGSGGAPDIPTVGLGGRPIGNDVTNAQLVDLTLADPDLFGNAYLLGGGGGGGGNDGSDCGTGGGGGAGRKTNGGNGSVGDSSPNAGGTRGGNGGKGGGYIILIAPEINIAGTGTLSANGADGEDGDGRSKGGAGGGGGGVVALLSPSITDSGTTTATGGAGGENSTGASTGGSGGVIGSNGGNGTAGSTFDGGAGGGGGGGDSISAAPSGTGDSKLLTSPTFRINSSAPGDLRLEATTATVKTIGELQLRKVA